MFVGQSWPGPGGATGENLSATPSQRKIKADLKKLAEVGRTRSKLGRVFLQSGRIRPTSPPKRSNSPTCWSRSRPSFPRTWSKSLKTGADVLLVQEHCIAGPGLPEVQAAAVGEGWHGIWDPATVHGSCRSGGTAVLTERPTQIPDRPRWGPYLGSDRGSKLDEAKPVASGVRVLTHKLPTRVMERSPLKMIKSGKTFVAGLGGVPWMSTSFQFGRERRSLVETALELIESGRRLPRNLSNSLNVCRLPNL